MLLDERMRLTHNDKRRSMKQPLLMGLKNSTRQSRNALVGAILLTFIGFSSILYGLYGSKQNVTAEPIVISETTQPVSPPQAKPVSLLRAEPRLLSVPSLELKSNLIQVGKNDDGTVEVPADPDHDTAAWYKYSVTPGEIGPSVFLGHFDSSTGPSVFYRLQDMKVGELIEVKRADDTLAKFKVSAVTLYPKDAFPTEKVYGPTKNSQIRLVTCGGAFNPSANDYDGNVVVFGDLIEQ